MINLVLGDEMSSKRGSAPAPASVWSLSGYGWAHVRRTANVLLVGAQADEKRSSLRHGPRRIRRDPRHHAASAPGLRRADPRVRPMSTALDRGASMPCW